MNQSTAWWTFWHALIMLIATSVSMIIDARFLLIWTASVSVGVFIITHYPVWVKIYPAGGYANHVTFGRFALLIVALSMQSLLIPIAFVGLIIMVMIADGIDGYLARKLRQSTRFGEVFDVEVDAFLALSLTLLIWLEHRDCMWVLAAGLLRYGFVIIYRLLGWHDRQRPAMPEAKVIAVIFFISLLIPFVLEWGSARWIVGAGCSLVAFSFLREFYLISHKSV